MRVLISAEKILKRMENADIRIVFDDVEENLGLTAFKEGDSMTFFSLKAKHEDLEICEKGILKYDTLKLMIKEQQITSIIFLDSKEKKEKLELKF